MRFSIAADELTGVAAAIAEALEDRGHEVVARHGALAPEERDDWRFLRVSSEAELVDLFAPRMYFGCEADDRTIARTAGMS